MTQPRAFGFSRIHRFSLLWTLLLTLGSLALLSACEDANADTETDASEEATDSSRDADHASDAATGSNATDASESPDATEHQDSSDSSETDAAEQLTPLPNYDFPCNVSDCGPQGSCDSSSGTCDCNPGTWFDGHTCAPVEDCSDCDIDCPVPLPPLLTVLSTAETLHFDAGDHPVELGYNADLSAPEPTGWLQGATLDLSTLPQGPVRLFARVASELCLDGPLFNAVVELRATYPPAAGEPESDAIFREDARFAGWATHVIDVQPGTNVNAPFDDPERALGPATGVSTQVYSLGRFGTVTLGFAAPIADGPGPDFAVFENSFSHDFLELALVEVSSDGTTWLRFDSASLTPDFVDAYGLVDTTQIGQIAGKYMQGYGTPLDLATLRQRPEVRRGLVDLHNISHLRIVDIVGDGDTRDSFGRPIYDPWPTVGSAGFDLDGVGVLNVVAGEGQP